MEIKIQGLNKKQMKVIGKMDKFIFTYRNNMKKDPEGIVLFRDDFNILECRGLTYKGFKVVSV